MKTKLTVALSFALVLALLTVMTAFANGTVNYDGKGFTFDGTTYLLNNERCADGLDANDGSTGAFATWNNPGSPWGDGSGGAYKTGQGYLLWILTANGATSATITLPNGNTYNMVQVGGTFKYASGYFPFASLSVVSATYVGTAKGKVNLTVSHGCPGFKEGAWCSPGFWKNAEDPAWALAGYNKTDYFNQTVVPNYYDTATPLLPPDGPTLNDVLTYSGQGGANHFGSASGPFGLNAYNATGAFLTDQIPGFQFDPSLVGNEEACPIDHHGNFK